MQIQNSQNNYYSFIIQHIVLMTLRQNMIAVLFFLNRVVFMVLLKKRFLKKKDKKVL